MLISFKLFFILFLPVFSLTQFLSCCLFFRSVKKERDGWRENDRMIDLYMCHSHMHTISYFIPRTKDHMIKAGFLQVRVSFHDPLAALPLVTSDAKFRYFSIWLYPCYKLFLWIYFVLWMVSVVEKWLAIRWHGGFFNAGYGSRETWGVHGICNGHGGISLEKKEAKGLGYVTLSLPCPKNC